ncbi:Sodium/calcium exchanger protein-domain-containing protein [Pseudomassariella vexata]|uniref:Vacuolar calcium ion transporter n=1 Tax=Pseudomassariella vexata TaxID=1141098 RepID=A0A1Y2E013_9PEZI|nr:Sodium/calcium exchanger protein-domain-containing protein [Pseudomassariella vexata]ORY64871.1 Sodium/calcium exchanger protein-domain-containing protein [Pseudomassariella vexata]
MASARHPRRSTGPHREKNHRISANGTRDATLPRHRQDIEHGTSGTKRRRRRGPKIRVEGESGRRGLHPLHFFRIIWRSTCFLSRAVNILWPIVPIAIAVYYRVEGHDTAKFTLAYIAMVPCANLIGFAGQELARKMPHMLGVLTETTIGSIVEIVLFMILLANRLYPVIQAAILGSILATMLLCLGMCFFASGIRREDAHFDEAITEAGSGLLLTAGVALAVPTIYEYSLAPLVERGELAWTTEQLDGEVLHISRAVAILLLIGYATFIFFQTRTHHGLFTAIFEHDEARDHDREKDEAKDKLTLTECIVALVISVGLVTIIAYILVNEIEPLVEHNGISDPFMGLILVPLVEKAAEHLTAVDEAWDNQMNFALSHCVGATLQTAMLNGPLVVLVGWIMNRPMSFNFEIFDMVMLVLAIITVGNFLRDQKTNYLEGVLCVLVYVAIATAAFFYPSLHVASAEGSGGEH